VHVVRLRPSECFFKTECSRIKCVGVEANFHGILGLVFGVVGGLVLRKHDVGAA